MASAGLAGPSLGRRLPPTLAFMDILRDPIWQFIGVVVAILVAAVPAVIWFVRRRSAANEKSQHEAIIAELKAEAEAERKAAERLNKQLGRSNIPLYAGVDFEPIPQNGFIEKEFNGQAIRAFLQGNSLHVEHEIPGGGTSYYIFDENGNAVAPQWPFPLEEYSVEIDPGLILKTTVEPLADGFTKETIEMKWGKRAVLTRNSQNQLAQILVTGSTLLHTEKKILFKAPDFKNKL